MADKLDNFARAYVEPAYQARVARDGRIHA